MDLERYKPKWGKLRELYPLSVDAETKGAIDELRAMGVDVAEFARDLLIPKLKELRDSMKGQANG